MKLHEITILEEASRCLLCYDPPCTKACPSGSDPAAFVKAIRFKNRAGGARVTLERNPLGGVCAAACPSEKYCEGACIRGKIDRPVEISTLHTFIAQVGESEGLTAAPGEKTGVTAAVLGAGMAGLAAAAALAQAGAAVTVYADGPAWGTELLAKRAELPREVLDGGLQTIKKLGVELNAGNSWEAPEGTLDAFDAVVVASKRSLAELAPNTRGNVFYTGELVPGPDDAAFSVKKGKTAARQVLAAKEGAK